MNKGIHVWMYDLPLFLEIPEGSRSPEDIRLVERENFHAEDIVEQELFDAGFSDDYNSRIYDVNGIEKYRAVFEEIKAAFPGEILEWSGSTMFSARIVRKEGYIAEFLYLFENKEEGRKEYVQKLPEGFISVCFFWVYSSVSILLHEDGTVWSASLSEQDLRKSTMNLKKLNLDHRITRISYDYDNLLVPVLYTDIDLPIMILIETEYQRIIRANYYQSRGLAIRDIGYAFLPILDLGSVIRINNNFVLDSTNTLYFRGEFVEGKVKDFRYFSFIFNRPTETGEYNVNDLLMIISTDDDLWIYEFSEREKGKFGQAKNFGSGYSFLPRRRVLIKSARGF